MDSVHCPVCMSFSFCVCFFISLWERIATFPIYQLHSLEFPACHLNLPLQVTPLSRTPRSSHFPRPVLSRDGPNGIHLPSAGQAPEVGCVGFSESRSLRAHSELSQTPGCRYMRGYSGKGGVKPTIDVSKREQSRHTATPVLHH